MLSNNPFSNCESEKDLPILKRKNSFSDEMFSPMQQSKFTPVFSGNCKYISLSGAFRNLPKNNNVRPYSNLLSNHWLPLRVYWVA